MVENKIVLKTIKSLETLLENRVSKDLIIFKTILYECMYVYILGLHDILHEIVMRI